MRSLSNHYYFWGFESESLRFPFELLAFKEVIDGWSESGVYQSSRGFMKVDPLYIRWDNPHLLLRTCLSLWMKPMIYQSFVGGQQFTCCGW